MKKALLVVVLAAILAACAAEKKEEYAELKISSVFKNGETIPKKYTCDGKDISPPLYISGIPPETKSIVIVCEDPDAPMGTFTHWIAWNIEPTNEIPENIPKTAIVSEPIRMQQGENDFGKVGYNGPCPPPGKPHRYYFKVYALDTKLEGNFDKKSLLKIIEGHIIAYGEIYGIYSR